MLKKLATTLLVLSVVGGNLFADAKNGGIARQISMGGSMAGSGLVLNPFIMDDPSMMLLNPAYQAMYKDYGWLGIGGGALTGLSTANNGYGQQNAGIAFSYGNEWSFGAILSYDPSAVRVLRTLLTGAAFGGATLPPFVRRAGGAQGADPGVANVWELLATYDMGALDLGFGFMYGNSNADSKTTQPTTPNPTTTETEASSSLVGFRFGMNYDLGSGSSIDATAAMRLDKVTDNVTISPTPTATGAFGADGKYSAKATEFQFTARGKFKMSSKFNFVPYGMIAMLSSEPKEDQTPTTNMTPITPLTNEKVTALAYAVGVGGEYRTSTFYFAGGVSMQSARAKVEVNVPATAATAAIPVTAKATYFSLPVLNLGGEWWFTDWLAGRAGYYRSLGKIKTETENLGGGGVPTLGWSTETNTTAPNSLLFIGGITPATHDGLVTLGLGFRFGNFALDATVSEEALRRGLGLIGANDQINTFGYMTASFNFAE